MRSMVVIVGLCTLVHGQTFKSTVDQVVVPVIIHTELAAAHAVVAPLERGDSVQVGTFNSILRGEYPRILRRSAI